ncbi:MAG: 2-succinyl-5-enolpyruvyl-6-hydroxy-3-cyclohexene-carboxylate synthase [Clostridia bacterium]|nr:2-succinyl-5-enolpyruvyl-6-hydroxy-3-cyclohexene-carboxylate synthase [Clostridia bacterium]
MTTNEPMTAYVAAFVDELARANVRNVVISPGSRSTPLAMVLAEHPDIKIWLNIDERSAGFFALGMAKAKKEVVALLCTSGTAAANYFPAVVEAKLSRVPLLVLTADRPHELRDVGAPQAIDQIRLYGNYPKWFVEMALPEDSCEMIKYVRTVAERAVSTAIAGPSGPVHLNFPFREPLIPNLSACHSIWDKGRENGERYVNVSYSLKWMHDRELYAVGSQLQKKKRGLIICGPDDNPALAKAVVRLADELNYPILADPLSQLRSGQHSKELIIDGYDAFLRNEEVVNSLQPEVIIRFGAMPISKSLLLYIKRYPKCQQIIIDEDNGWRDPTLMASNMIYTEPVHFCNNLVNYLSSCSNRIQAQKTNWLKKWLMLNQITRDIVLKNGRTDNLFEGQVFIELTELLPPNATLYVGNSMPIRDLDTFFRNNDCSFRVLANRGANGIDGVVSSALGASTAVSPLVLVIGDLSFFHDLNGLLAAKLYGLNITIIVFNNDGGGIFSFLPQAKNEKYFEDLFGTPTGLDFRHVVEMYCGRFIKVNSWELFRNEVKNSINSKGLTVIEVPTERKSNMDMHRKIWQAVLDKLSLKMVEVNNL